MQLPLGIKFKTQHHHTKSLTKLSSCKHAVRKRIDILTNAYTAMYARTHKLFILVSKDSKTCWEQTKLNEVTSYYILIT